MIVRTFIGEQLDAIYHAVGKTPNVGRIGGKERIINARKKNRQGGRRVGLVQRRSEERVDLLHHRWNPNVRFWTR